VPAYQPVAYRCLPGPRRLAQVDQGLNPKIPLGNGRSFGLSGGLYNKCQVTLTK